MKRYGPVIQPNAPSVAGFVPLAQILQAQSPEKLAAARARAATFDRAVLIDKFRAAFAGGKRVVAFVLADELSKRGLPPCFRHHHLSATTYSTNQEFDLMAFDLRWLRREYPDHVRAVKFKRCRALFVGSESGFHREAEFAFYGGVRAAWKLVKSFCLTEEQQLDCFWLRSAPIAKRLETAHAMRDKVFKALQGDLQATRRTKTFTDDDAKAALLRRHRLWVCRGHTTGGPSEIAKKYKQLTGEEISRQIVSRQLCLVDEVLRKSRSNRDEN
ncbi:hypothetical protein [Collimonas antrihumi]|uniref:hypothetical protein n=1 Tax=Collimonas antrihumi TaxID=1940615 RepID=UPI001B8D2450|nr:hypothetical protein [Collimonas antrihumi]